MYSPAFSSGVSSRFANPSQPKFGWGWDAHRVIEKASAQLLPDSSFKDFLHEGMDTINRLSVEQDTQHPGPKHYLDVEMVPHHTSTPHLASTPESRDWKHMRQYFTRRAKTLKKRELEREPIRPQQVAHFDNVFNTSVALYRQFVQQLRQVHTINTLSTAERGALKAKLTATVAELSHYVGDLHQPLHTTSYTSWDLAFPGKHPGGSHLYMEVDMLDQQDHDHLEQQIAKSGHTPRSMPLSWLQSLLLTRLQQGYLQLYDMVRVDARARHGNPNAALYFKRLKEGWSAITSHGVKASAHTLSDVLYSAYREAGMPNMRTLDVPGPTTPQHQGPGQKINRRFSQS